MATFPSAVVTKPAGITPGSTIFDTQVDDGWDEVIAIEGNLLGGGSGAFILDIRPTAAGNTVFRTRQASADTQFRFALTGQGRLDWGSGTAVADVGLLRSAARTLQLLGSAQVLGQNAADIALEVRGFTAQSTDYVRVTATGGSPTVLSVTSAGQLTLPTTGAGAGVLIGADAQLYRGAADTLTTPDSLQVGGTVELTGGTSLLTARAATAVSTVILASRVTGNANDRLSVRADGQLAWGGGTTGTDTTLSRTNANELTLSGTLICGAIQSSSQLLGGDLTLGAGNTIIGTLGTATTTNKLRVSVAADTQDRLQIRADGRLTFGTGSAVPDYPVYRSGNVLIHGGIVRVEGNLELGSLGDANLYRNGVGLLKTDSALEVAGANLTLSHSDAVILMRNEDASGNLILGTRVAGDSVDRLAVTASGGLSWGPGSGAADVTLARQSTGLLRTGNHLEVNGAFQFRADAGTNGAPAYSFSAGLTTGLVYVASGPQRMAMVVNGTANSYFSSVGLSTGMIWPIGSRLSVSGGSSSGVGAGGLVEMAHSAAVSNSHSFGAFPDPGTGGLYIDQKLFLGSVADVYLQRTAAGDIGISRPTAAKTRLRLQRPDGATRYLEIDNGDQILVSTT